MSSSNIATPRPRRRAVVTCVECRKRKQKCDRKLPCVQCTVRGTESGCRYERYYPKKAAVSTASGLPSSKSLEMSPDQTGTSRRESPGGSALLEHAHEYGYSNSDSLNSMGMLTQVVTDISMSHPAVASQTQQHRIRSEYYGYVRRLPPVTHCEMLIQLYFASANQYNAALDGIIFREQLERWWTLAHAVLLEGGPQALPEDIRCFPALLFQVLAVALQFLPSEYDTSLDQLRFGPSQTFIDLSIEYTDCGVAISNLLGTTRPTFMGVQRSFLHGCWLVHRGDLLQAWNHSGQTVRDAMAIGLHLEPELPLSSQPEVLLDALWMNELRKRIWLNLFVWDNYMAIALGRPMFIILKDCTVTAPIDCDIPKDRLKRVPVARLDIDRPTPMTERLLRYQMSLRLGEIRELESQGPIPCDPEKVKELHTFAINFRKSLPCFFQNTNPDTTWDTVCHFLPLHREMLSYLIDSFLMTLHRPYIFTRDKSQRQVYETSLAILDSQTRHFEVLRTAPTQVYISSTFPTFDAAVLLAVVLVSNPERYYKFFTRPYQSLQNAIERLQFMGSTLALAQAGAEILQSTLRRVEEAQRGVVGPIIHRPYTDDVHPSGIISSPPLPLAQVDADQVVSGSATSVSVSPDTNPWRFEMNPSIMDWTTQRPELSDYDFSNLEVPMPLKELLLDEELTVLADGRNVYSSALWMPELMNQQFEDCFIQAAVTEPPLITDLSENLLWNFLASYSTMVED